MLIACDNRRPEKKEQQGWGPNKLSTAAGAASTAFEVGFSFASLAV